VLNHERFLAEQAEKAKKATKTETGFVIKPKPEQEPWRNFPVPFGGSAGVLLGNLDKKKALGLVGELQSRNPSITANRGSRHDCTRSAVPGDARRCRAHYEF